MNEDRIQDIYDNGAELTTRELGQYLRATVESNDVLTVALSDAALPTWIQHAELNPDAIVRATAEAFDWKLEHRGVDNWYLHPWGD